MKTSLIVLALTVLAPTFAQAKLTVFRTEDAAKLVFTDGTTLEKAKKISSADNFVSLSVESDKVNTFDVTLELSKLDYRCFVNVEVITKGETIQLPSGGKISTNKLVVRSVKAEKCIE